MNSPLGRIVGSGTSSPDDLRRLAAEAWRRRGVLVLFPADLAPAERAACERWAARLYGEQIASEGTGR